MLLLFWFVSSSSSSSLSSSLALPHTLSLSPWGSILHYHVHLSQGLCINAHHTSPWRHTFIKIPAHTHTGHAGFDHAGWQILIAVTSLHRGQKCWQIQWRDTHMCIKVPTYIIMERWSVHPHTHRKFIQSQVKLTATLLFLKGTLHKISSPHHLSPGIFVYLHNTHTHTGKHCRLKLMYPHIHAQCGGNVPTLQICLVTLKAVKSGMFFFLLRHHEGVRLVNLRSIFSTGFIMCNIKDDAFIMHNHLH